MIEPKVAREFLFPIVGTDQFYDEPVSRDPATGDLYVLHDTGIAAPTVASVVRWNNDVQECAV